MERFTKDTTLAEVLKNPENGEILVKFRVPCFGCPHAQYEMDELTIGGIGELYGIDTSGLLEELNEKTDEKKKN